MPFLAYLLLFGAWALSTPYDGSPDEVSHIWHAYAVVSGDFAPPLTPDGATQMVPRSLPADQCFAGKPDLSASCATGPGGDETLVPQKVSAGRYNPAYYLAVGWPLVISPDLVGVLTARLVSAALVALLFGWATVAAVTLRGRGALLGLIVGLTPMTAHIAGAINPNAIEIAAGAGLITALIAILFEPDGAGAHRWTWWLAGVSGAVMLTVRAAGPLWFALTLAVMLVALRRSRYVELLRSRRTWWLLGSWTVIGLAGVGWTLWRRAYEIMPSPPEQPLTLIEALRREVVVELSQTLKELVGVLGWLDTILPREFYLLWWSAFGCLVLVALIVGQLADRWRIAALGGLGLGVPILLEAFQVNQYGFILQGRYLLPMLIGVPILAGYVLTQRLAAYPTRWLTMTAAAVLLLAEIASLCFMMIRYEYGLATPSINLFGGSWQPAVGPLPPILMARASMVIFMVYYRRVTAGRPGDVRHRQAGTTELDLVGAPAAPPLAGEEASG